MLKCPKPIQLSLDNIMIKSSVTSDLQLLVWGNVPPPFPLVSATVRICHSAPALPLPTHPLSLVITSRWKSHLWKSLLMFPEHFLSYQLHQWAIVGSGGFWFVYFARGRVGRQPGLTESWSSPLLKYVLADSLTGDVIGIPHRSVYYILQAYLYTLGTITYMHQNYLILQ